MGLDQYFSLCRAQACTSSKRGRKGFSVKRDRLLLFAVTGDCKKLKAVNCGQHARHDT